MPKLFPNVLSEYSENNMPTVIMHVDSNVDAAFTSVIFVKMSENGMKVPT